MSEYNNDRLNHGIHGNAHGVCDFVANYVLYEEKNVIKNLMHRMKCTKSRPEENDVIEKRRLRQR